MRRVHAVLLLCFASISYAKTKIVVLEVKSSDAATLRLAGQLQEQLLTELSGNARFEVIGKSDIETLLGVERQKQLLGCADASNCIAELGGALGAQYIVLGAVGRAGKRFRLDLKVIDAKETKAIFRGGKTLEREDELYAAVDELARNMAAAIPVEVEPPPRPAVVVEPPAVVAAPRAAPSRPLLPLFVSGAGAVVAISGVALLAVGAVQQGGFDAARPGLTFSEAQARVASIERNFNIGWALAGVGLALVAAGIVWFLVSG